MGDRSFLRLCVTLLIPANLAELAACVCEFLQLAGERMGWHNRMATRTLVPAAVGYAAPWGAASWRERGGMGLPFSLLGVGWGTETCVCYFRPRPESVYMDPSELHPGPK